MEETRWGFPVQVALGVRERRAGARFGEHPRRFRGAPFTPDYAAVPRTLPRPIKAAAAAGKLQATKGGTFATLMMAHALASLPLLPSMQNENCSQFIQTMIFF